MKQIILCADDYGQNTTISQAIVELARAGRLSAVSCMVNGSDFNKTAPWLMELVNKVDIGLHFNLTHGKPLSAALGKFYSLKELILKSNCRLLPKRAIKTELYAQLEKFSQAFGRRPDFIDGHQHVHQFPKIRDVLLDVYTHQFSRKDVYLRSTYFPGALKSLRSEAYVKRGILQLCGGFHFYKALNARHIPHNKTFAGVYHFQKSLGYDELFPKFLQQVQHGGLIMCHPGLYSREETAVIAQARHHEYNYFNSTVFEKLLKGSKVKLARYSEIII